MVFTESAAFRLIQPESAKELVFSFESALGSIDHSDLRRSGFGESFLLQNGYAVVSILPNEANWYRPKDIHDFLTSSELQTFASKFDVLHTYGSSMGAFGACTFAEALNADNVIAISPISTLNSTLVPWEKRFRNGITQDWTGSFSDAARGLGKRASIYCLYDETCPDSRHVARLSRFAGENLKKILVPNARHAVAMTLSAQKLLKPIVLDCLLRKDLETVLRSLDKYNAEEGNNILNKPNYQGPKARLALLN